MDVFIVKKMKVEHHPNHVDMIQKVNLVVGG